MEDNSIIFADDIKKEDTERVISSLEAAKELRSILPYCRQIAALKRYFQCYLNGDLGGAPGYALMIDNMAKQFGVKTCAWLIVRIDYENRERFGEPMKLEDLPACLRIDTGDGRSIESVSTRITAEEDYLRGLKSKALYIADQKGELQYIKVGYDSGEDKFWQQVTWKLRDFVIPASGKAITKCKKDGLPKLPSYMTTEQPSVSPRKRSSALDSASIVEKYIIQNKIFLQGYEEYMAEIAKHLCVQG